LRAGLAIKRGRRKVFISNTETPPQGVENMKAIRRASKRVSRKAVSPVVATVILVLISVVAGVMLWLWVSGFTSAATAQQPALNERIKIEAVKVDTTHKNVTVIVRNVGSVPVTITDLYVIDYQGNTIDHTSFTSAISIEPGAVDKDNVKSNQGLSVQSGRTYTVKVVTKNGVEATYSFVWP
jgi:flagellin-like protein